MPLYTDQELQDLLNNTSNVEVPFEGGEPFGGFNMSDFIETLNLVNISEEFGDILEDSLTKFGSRYRAPNLHFYTQRTPQEIVSHPFEPKKLYFYYLKFDTDGSIISRIFSDDINPTHLQTSSNNLPTIKQQMNSKITYWLANNPTGQTNINQNGLESLTLDNIGWNEPCYLAFMLDAKGWDFFRSSDSHNALHFSKQPTTGNRTTNSNKHQCFCNSFIDSQIGPRPILFVENRHISATTGEPREYDDPTRDLYKFDLFFRVSTSPKTYIDPQNPSDETEKKITMIIDPTGTNFGPP